MQKGSQSAASPGKPDREPLHLWSWCGDSFDPCFFYLFEFDDLCAAWGFEAKVAVFEAAFAVGFHAVKDEAIAVSCRVDINGLADAVGSWNHRKIQLLE